MFHNSSPQPGYYLIRIYICGCPFYMFGHNLILLVKKAEIEDQNNNYLLAHVHVKVPEGLPHLSDSFFGYWKNNLFTNRLDKIVLIHQGYQEVLEKIQQIKAYANVFKCKMWQIDQDSFDSTYARIIGESEQDSVDKFCFAGEKIGKLFNCNGSNCWNWEESILSAVGADDKNKQPINYTELINLIKGCIPVDDIDVIPVYNC